METVKRSRACGKISITASLTLKPGPRFVLLVNTNCKKTNTRRNHTATSRPNPPLNSSGYISILLCS